jgi:tetratricopeptide (TPR) repeat protein
LRALFLDGDDKPPSLRNEYHKGWILNSLGNAYSLNGQPHRAVPVFESAILFAEEKGHTTNLIIGLGNLAYMAQIQVGALKQADDNLRRSIHLSSQVGDLYWHAAGQNGLGRVLSYIGEWQEAKKRLDASFKYHKKQNDHQGLSIDWSYQTLRILLMARADPKSIPSLAASIEFASYALELADETANAKFPHLRDYIDAYWLLGAAYHANGELKKAEENLSKAINICRQINLVESEANILLNLARLRYDQMKNEEAKSLADEALLITERCGYVLQGADVNLFLAQYALEQEKDKARAKEYAETALKLAYCDGPPYYYKVAYEEAERMLEKL